MGAVCDCDFARNPPSLFNKNPTGSMKQGGEGMQGPVPFFELSRVNARHRQDFLSHLGEEELADELIF